jgi:predicted NUDIX family NTP pyrophosphohydrolase
VGSGFSRIEHGSRTARRVGEAVDPTNVVTKGMKRIPMTPGDRRVTRTSAGILLYRRREGRAEVLIVHPGGPFFARKHEGAWTIPKGEPNPGESLLDTARREFAEETGFAPEGRFVELTPVVQKGGKRVHAFAVEGDWDPSRLACNTFTLEWPRGSGRIRQYPEVDRAEWCPVDEARRRLNPAQAAWLDELEAMLDGAG